jgi:hypothetical protein
MCTELTQMARVAVDCFVIVSVRMVATGILLLPALPRRTRCDADPACEREASASGPWCPRLDVAP